MTLLGTGGTIASVSTDHGVVARAAAAELLVAASQVRPVPGTVVARDLGARPSFALGLDDMHEIATAACAAAVDGPVVVTHGTDSMEETSFMTDLLYAGEQPIVFTGAQRAFDAADPDGPANLADALRVAADPGARGRGVLLSFGGRLWPAKGVRKTQTQRLDAFEVPDAQPVSLSGPGPSVPRSTMDAPTSKRLPLPRVDVVAAVPGGDGAAVRAAVRAGAAGVVLQGLGIGNAAPGDTDAVAEAVAAGVPVLITTRVLSGPVQAVYGAGGGVDLERAGAVLAGSLTPWHARVLLAMMLATTEPDPAAGVRRWLQRVHA